MKEEADLKLDTETLEKDRRDAEDSKFLEGIAKSVGARERFSQVNVKSEQLCGNSLHGLCVCGCVIFAAKSIPTSSLCLYHTDDGIRQASCLFGRLAIAIFLIGQL